MRPPIGAVCDRDVDPREEGADIAFRPEPGQESTRPGRAEEVSRDDFAGHPGNVAWFCSDHQDAAERLPDLTPAEALERLNAVRPER
ncbi:MAG: hypothetical protein ACOC8B_02695 [Gemmatimonadota bacterium]